MNDHEINREAWDAIVDWHADASNSPSRLVRAGQSTLRRLECEVLAESPSIDNASLLHLMCQFGADTISLARRGYRVTGVDISGRSIKRARELAHEVKSDAEFVADDVCRLDSLGDSSYATIYQAYGTYFWIADLQTWSENIVSRLISGGRFVLIDSHPLEQTFFDPPRDYFDTTSERLKSVPDFVDPSRTVPGEIIQWPHTLSDIIQALLDGGLRFERLDEFPFLYYPRDETWHRTHDNFFTPATGPTDYPLLFRLTMTKGAPKQPLSLHTTQPPRDHVPYHAANRIAWDEVTPVHEKHPGYEVDSFLAGKSKLLPTEQELLGNVRGKKLLHLQCHFGLDSLSWSRLGAIVTGVDQSTASITTARRLAERSGLSAEFIEADVAALPESLTGRFDMAVHTYGVWCWLANMYAVAQQVVRALKPGGRYLLIDDHPIIAQHVEPAWSYFEPGPYRSIHEPDYMDPDYRWQNEAFEWMHTTADMLNACALAGLRLITYRELPLGYYQLESDWIQDDCGFWTPPSGAAPYPLVFAALFEKLND